LRAILSIFKLFGGEAFKLVSPSPDVRRTLEIAGMADQVGIFDDVPGALASFR
jgi:anti-anti-sigma regulatory factor